MRAPILRALHDSKTGGHLGQAKTAEKVKASKFYWPGIVEYANRWVKGCNKCAACKHPKHAKRSPLQTYRVGATGDRYSSDLCGPFHPPTRNGKQWILTVTDWYTRYVKAYSLTRATADKVARCLYDFITTFGFGSQLNVKMLSSNQCFLLLLTNVPLTGMNTWML